ncbi:MAG TPA: hypothetical protein VMB02_13215 [Candidatus Aquilonibacter sp.]|nr:hypothetical protein [Candidatus Aquilonibacter sp.]
MTHGPVNVLLIGENERAWWHLAGRLEKMGCRSWFASTPEEARTLIDRHPFPLILSSSPVTKHNPLMQLVRPESNAFYFIPVEDSCLWFQAVPEDSPTPRASALRPAEFMRVLSQLIARSNRGLDPRRPPFAEASATWA